MIERFRSEIILLCFGVFFLFGCCLLSWFTFKMKWPNQVRKNSTWIDSWHKILHKQRRNLIVQAAWHKLTESLMPLKRGGCFCHQIEQTTHHISDLSISTGPTNCEEEENQRLLSLLTVIQTTSFASVGFFLKTELSQLAYKFS